MQPSQSYSELNNHVTGEHSRTLTLRLHLIYVSLSKLCHKDDVMNITNITLFATAFIYIQI
jgi:hypothetical protein